LRWLRQGGRLLGAGLPRTVRAALGDRAPRRITKALDLLAATERERFRLLRSAVTPDERRRLYHPGLLQRLDSGAVGGASRPIEDEPAEEADDRAFADDLQHYLPEDLLVKVDRASMAHALECRSPLLDHRLVEFACSLPPEWKLQGGATKRIFKETFGPLLPPGVLNRPKMGFSAPIGAWLRGPLRAYLADKLLRGPLARVPIVNPDYIRTLMDEHDRGVRQREAILWHCLMLGLWFEEYGAI
jgi:asparagine synthase (glutamine-hydrolysing)